MASQPWERFLPSTPAPPSSVPLPVVSADEPAPCVPFCADCKRPVLREPVKTPASWPRCLRLQGYRVEYDPPKGWWR